MVSFNHLYPEQAFSEINSKHYKSKKEYENVAIQKLVHICNCTKRDYFPSIRNFGKSQKNLSKISIICTCIKRCQVRKFFITVKIILENTT